MYAKRVSFFFGIAFAILGSLPALNLANRAWLTEDSFLPDRIGDLWSVDSAEGLFALTLWRCCETSLHEGDVVVGKNGFLFLGNDHDRVIDKIRGDFNPAQSAIESWAENIEALQETVTQSGAAFAFALAPNKHGVHRQALPEDISHAAQTVTDRTMAALALRGVSLIDLRDVFPPLDNIGPVYFKTDTHWTAGGAALGYRAIVSALRDLGVQAQPLTFRVQPQLGPAGDLARMLKTQDTLGDRHEADQQVIFDGRTVCEVENTLTSRHVALCDPSADETVPLPLSRGVISSISPEADNPQTLLIICDSFCDGHQRLFQASFAQTHLVHWKSLSEIRVAELLERLDPDIVLFQLVERALLLPRFKM
ncbi:MAG: hypothetical protein AAF672_12325 [Pseudomonadota bacterium]